MMAVPAVILLVGKTFEYMKLKPCHLN